MEDGFKVGDRVEAVFPYDENYSIVGKCGTIVKPMETYMESSLMTL